jgi:DNA-binding CsgD family transcriptional regulator
VVTLRQQGWSLRRIAEQMGVSEFTVRQHLKEATAINIAVELPDRTIGKDGKSRPATRPKPKPSVFVAGAERMGVSEFTVRQRHKEATSINIEVELPDRTIGKDGKQYPASRRCRNFYTCRHHRRRCHLTPGQRAALALAVKPHLEAEARRRQQEAGKYGIEGGRGHRKEETLVENFPQGFGDAESGRVRDQLADLFGVNHAYIDYAAYVAARDPDLLERVKAGEVNLRQAYRDVRQRELVESAPPAPPHAAMGESAMTREQRRELVAQLKAEGLSLRRIAQRLGIGAETVRCDLAYLARLSRLSSETPAPACRPTTDVALRWPRRCPRCRGAVMVDPPTPPDPEPDVHCLMCGWRCFGHHGHGGHHGHDGVS